MTRRDVLSVSFRILGVLSAMGAVSSVPQIGVAISMVAQGTHQEYNPVVLLLGTILSPVLYLAMAFVLIRGAEMIATRMLPEDAPIAAPELGKDWERPIFGLALRITGVFCLVWGVPMLGKILVDSAFRLKYRGVMGPQALISLAGILILLLIGLYLISGGSRLVSFAFRRKNP